MEKERRVLEEGCWMLKEGKRRHRRLLGAGLRDGMDGKGRAENIDGCGAGEGKGKGKVLM